MATPTDLDVRDWPEDTRRERLFETLLDHEVGAELDIVADRDLDPELVRYQLDHGHALDWEYADPDAEPRELRVTVGAALDATASPSIDVRDLTPQRRHEVLLAIFDDLEAGGEFVLVNDHDPKPLYHELRSMHGDIVDWTYASRGGGEWRVEIGKTGASEAATDDEDDVISRYDVRDIPKQERHPTIHHRYGMLPDGGTMELIAGHEPRPLHEEFRQQYGDTFTWSVVESEPGRCRVRITKQAAAETAEDEAAATDDGLEITEELDVRDLPPAKRHEQIFDAYADLERGEAFILVNDHDPKPLYHQFEAEAGDAFDWEYRQQEPGEFRVRIGKSDSLTTDVSQTDHPNAPF